MCPPFFSEPLAAIDAALARSAKLHGLGDGKGRWQRKTLVDELHARGPAFADLPRPDVVSHHVDGARGRLDEAGRHAGKGGLAGPVLTDDRMDLAGSERS
ncbi:hypothetical protein D9M68_393350 [compost metagenome]